MLRSSQGGRWLRSQSLMQDKSPFQKTGNQDLFSQNYHRNTSKLSS